MNTVDTLFSVGAHFGFAKSRRHPSATPFIFGAKNKVEIFDLEKTEKEFAKALTFISRIVAEGKSVIFVGTKIQLKAIIKAGVDNVALTVQALIADKVLGK